MRVARRTGSRQGASATIVNTTVTPANPTARNLLALNTEQDCKVNRCL